MNIIKPPIPGLLEIEPNVFGDERGYFFESYNSQVFHDAGIKANFLQDNQSFSHKGVLRGLHFQEPPHAQAKLVRVIKGSVMDVAVDIRKGSPTYGKYHKVILSEENKKMFWIPEGFAHGFLTLENNTIFFYKCSALYNKESENAIFYKDPNIGIDWEIDDPILSEKDKVAAPLSALKSKFVWHE